MPIVLKSGTLNLWEPSGPVQACNWIALPLCACLHLWFHWWRGQYTFVYLKKVKCNLVQALRFCTGHTAHTGSRGVALPFHDHGTRRGWGVSIMPQPLFTPGNNRYLGGLQGLVWTGVESLAPPWVRSPDHPAHSQLLYRLRYLAHLCVFGAACNNVFGNMLVNHISVILLSCVCRHGKKRWICVPKKGEITILSVTSLSFGEFAGQNSILVFDQLP
jgi:hypothetical protein